MGVGEGYNSKNSSFNKQKRKNTKDVYSNSGNSSIRKSQIVTCYCLGPQIVTTNPTIHNKNITTHSSIRKFLKFVGITRASARETRAASRKTRAPSGAAAAFKNLERLCHQHVCFLTMLMSRRFNSQIPFNWWNSGFPNAESVFVINDF